MDKELRVGDNINIPRKCPHTDREYRVNRNMKQMVGKSYKIDSIRGSCITIDGWSWHIKDFVDSTFHFDIERLDKDEI